MVIGRTSYTGIQRARHIGVWNTYITVDDKTGRLEKETREKLAERIMKRLEASEPYEHRRVSLRVIMQTQARHLATFVRGERAIYTPFVASW